MSFRTYRKPHILAKAKTTQLPSNLLFFDTETQDVFKGRNNTVQKHQFWFGSAIHTRIEGERVKCSRSFHLKTVDHFWQLLNLKMSKDKPLYVFAHNLAFDLTIVDFWNRHSKEGFELTYAVLENPPLFFSLTKGDRKVCIVDTFNFWKQPLSALGEALGLPKLEMPKDKTITPEWRRYALRDVEILEKQILNLFQFLRENELGSFRISAPGLAFGTYRRRFMKHDIYIHDRTKVLALERACYSGGMVRNYYLGKVTNSKVYKYDVNSLYPYVMLREFPVKLLEDFNDVSVNQFKYRLRGHGACAIVDLVCYDRTYPKRYNNRLCEVTGKYRAFLCGEELKVAIQSDHVKRIEYAALYQVDNIFNSYIRYFWELRKKHQAENNVVGSTFTKLLMNSLYGRFGMKGHKWVEFNNKNLSDYYTYFGVSCPDKYLKNSFSPIVDSFRHQWHAEGLEEPIVLRYFGGLIEMQFPTGEHSESFCAISAFVTSYAREYLRNLIFIAGEKEVYYCDTDSIFCTELGSKRLIKAGKVNPKELGMLKLEGISKHTEFYGPKDYIFNDEPVRKGIRKNALQISEDTFEQDAFEGLKSVLNRGGEPYIEITRIQKTLKRQLTKGVMSANGRVTPIILNQPY